jgi:superfamily II DNA helicase RecQ
VYQIRLLEARQARIPLDEGLLRSRKKNALEKIEWMQLYAESMVCREVFLRRYFGETKPEDCGHCDNCERAQRFRQQGLTMEQVQDLFDLLGSEESLNYSEIRERLAWSKERIDSALFWLLSQQLIEEIPKELLSYRVVS